MRGLDPRISGSQLDAAKMTGSSPVMTRWVLQKESQGA
jgi:hypothetical protein